MFNFQFFDVIQKQYFKSLKDIDMQYTSNVTIPENLTQAMKEFAKQLVEKISKKVSEDLFWCYLLNYETSNTFTLAHDQNAMLKEFLQEKLEGVKFNSTTGYENFQLKLSSYKMSIKNTCSKLWGRVRAGWRAVPIGVLVISH